MGKVEQARAALAQLKNLTPKARARRLEKLAEVADGRAPGDGWLARGLIFAMTGVIVHSAKRRANP